MESIFGGLIEFEDTKEFDDFVFKMDKNQALLVLTKSLEFCQQNGVYNLMEANALYKCLTKLKENANKNQGDHLHNDDTNGDIS
jgi:ribosomal protein L22